MENSLLRKRTLSPSSKEYQDTKLLKQGRIRLEAPFRQLAEWMSQMYGIVPINIFHDTFYDFIERRERPCLNVIVELYRDQIHFLSEDGLSYQKTIQDRIASQFIDLINAEDSPLSGTGAPNQAFDLTNLWVNLDAFEPVALVEASEAIPGELLKELTTQFTHLGLWHIARSFSVTTFFFFTDQQMEESKTNGVRQSLSEAYLELLKPYDAFGYFTPERYYAYFERVFPFDSKENFDTNYSSNWYYYYK